MPIRPHIVVVGSSNADMVVSAERLPTPGETVIGHSFRMNAGGKGANQACAAARLGAHVSFISKLGSDMFAEQAMEMLDNFGVDMSGITHDGETSTGIALIVVDDHGENAIAVAPGANYSLKPRDLERARELLRNADLIVCQYEIPANTIAFLVELCDDMCKRIMINPAPASLDFLAREAYAKVDILVPNEHEASILLGRPIEGRDAALSAAQELMAWGIGTVVITLGRQGCVAATADGRTFSIPAFEVETVDTTAAGDCFIGALACAIGSGSPIENALQFACAAGALSVTRHGAQSSLPFQHEVEELLGG